MARSAKPPKYRLQTKNGRTYACVTLRDAVTGRKRDYGLGPYGSEVSHARYARLLACWQAAGKRLPDSAPPSVDGPSVASLAHAYRSAIATRHGPSERAAIDSALRVLVQAFGDTAAAEFGPADLRLVREAMIHGDPAADPPRRPWTRSSINRQIHRIRAVWRWAASYELLPVDRYQVLRSVEPLRAGWSTAVESPPVRPVPIPDVEATLPYLSRNVADMVRLQMLTGMRPGEVCAFQLGDLDTSDPANWIARLKTHKTKHLGKRRIIYLGPRATDLLLSYMTKRRFDAHVFSPTEAEMQRQAARRAARKTPPSQGNGPGTHRVAEPQRAPNGQYTPTSYRRAVVRAIERHNRDARAADRPIMKAWSPNQIRHTFATEIRRQYGLEVAQILLGHSSALVTEAVYAERDERRAKEVVREIG